MRNFNTNQTRHLYVSGAINANVNKDRNAADNAAASNLDIALNTLESGEMYFSYKNADGLITRSDTFDPKKIVSLKQTLSGKMDIPLKAHKITLSGDITLSNLAGKTINLVVTLHDMIDFDSEFTFVASLVGTSTNTASNSAFFNAMAGAIFKALPEFGGKYPAFSVYVCKSATATKITKSNADNPGVSSATCIVLAQELQKYVRGKLTGEPISASITFRVAETDEVWGVDTESTVAALNSTLSTSISPTVYPSNYTLADLEYFAYGERGDVYRGFNFPNDYTPTYAINPNSGTYDMLSIEFYWAGEAENVQKSPRLIQVAAPHNASAESDIVTILYNAISTAMNGGGSGSGAGA